MASVENSLRPFWAPGLNEISGKVEKGLSGWLTDGEYQIYSPLQPDSFVLNIAESAGFLSSLAADVNRFAAAAFETVHQITVNRELPRSTAWLVIKTYYAAFFAAHAIARMLGFGVVYIGGGEAKAVTRIADIYGTAGGNSVTKGGYEFAYDANQRAILFRRANQVMGGAHESFWGVFNEKLRDLSNRILSSQTLSTTDSQPVSIRLGELCDNLFYLNQGAWLAVIRNDVTYRHRRGAWFPYSCPKTLSSQLFGARECWQSDPMAISLSEPGLADLRRFQNTCGFLVALCRVLAKDMETRCPVGRSFHAFGSMAILNLMNRSART